MVFKSHLVPFLGIPDAFASQFVQKLILCLGCIHRKMQKDLTKQQNPDTLCREVNCYANGCFHPTYSDLSLAGYHSEVYQ